VLRSVCVCSLVSDSDPVDLRPPCSSVHRTLKARILEGLPFPSPGCYTVGTCVFYIQYIIVSANPKLVIYPFPTYRYLFLIFSVSVRSLMFLFFIFASNVPLLSPIFLERSYLSHLLFSSISLH